MNGRGNAISSSSRLPELDGLRAIAILLVLFSHHLAGVPIAWINHLVEMGWTGVDLFFVLSGFLIGGIVLDQRETTNFYKVFYLRRFLRIVPLYALLVVPGLLVLGFGLQSHFAGHSLAHQSGTGMWLCVFFLQNIGVLFGLEIPAYLGPTWSVAIEEQFYLLLPPLVRMLDAKKLLWILGSAIVFAPVLRGILIFFLGDTAALPAYILLPCRWDSLLLGVFCAFLYRQEYFSQWVASRLVRLQWLWCLLGLLSLALLGFSQGRLDLNLAFLGYTVIDAWFACTLLLAVMNPVGGMLHRVLSWDGFKPVATISYGLYLLQSPVAAVVEGLIHCVHWHYPETGWAATVVGLFSLALTWMAATISWRCFESRMIRIGHAHKYKAA